MFQPHRKKKSPGSKLLLKSNGTRPLLTMVLEVERELEGRLEAMVGGGGSHLQNHRESSESKEVYTQDITTRRLQ